jgi:hypothetical protein
MKAITLTILFGFTSVSGSFATDPVRYIENKNQWDGNVVYRAEVQGGLMAFYTNKFQYYFESWANRGDHDHPTPQGELLESGHRKQDVDRVHVVSVEFEGAHHQVSVKGKGAFGTKYHYYLGDDRSRWASNVKAYEEIYYSNVYSGIDLRFYSENTLVKYEWIVQPQVNPSTISMVYNGVESMFLQNENLVFKTSIVDVTELKPFAYQMVHGVKREVVCYFELQNNRISYSFPNGYDTCEVLVIDPILIFSAYSGSRRDNWGNTATYDDEGNAYSGGIVSNTALPFPVTEGAFQKQHGGNSWDVSIMKFDSAGSSLLYCTFLGGQGNELPKSLYVNGEGDLLILGITSSKNFPVTNGTTFQGGKTIEPIAGVDFLGTDIFVTKLSADGSALLAGSYLGGSENDGVNFISGRMHTASQRVSPLARNYGDQFRGDVITDSEHNVYIVSNTLSKNFPIVNTNTVHQDSLDAIVVKLKPDLSSIVWSRFIGGKKSDAAYSIRSFNETFVVAGGTNSETIVGINGNKTQKTGDVDGWIMSLTNDGDIINGTFIGTLKYDQCYFVDVDAVGDVYVFGQTQGAFPVTENVYSNEQAGQFVMKLSNDLKHILWSTVFGSGNFAPNISPTAFMVSACGIYVGGWGGRTNALRYFNSFDSVNYASNYVGGNTRDMPITDNAYQKTTRGNDFYFAIFSNDATQLLYATYFGGVSSATHVDGGTSRFDKRGVVYQAVCAGCGGFSDFPAVNVNDAFKRNQSTNCNNAVFKFDMSLLSAKIQTNTVNFDQPGITQVCLPDKIVFENKSFGGVLYEWDFGDGQTYTQTDTAPIVHQYTHDRNSYVVTLKAINPTSCFQEDIATVTVSVFEKDMYAQENDVICAETPYVLTTFGAIAHEWTAVGFTSTENRPLVVPLDTTKYYVKMTDQNGCTHQDSVTLYVVKPLVLDFNVESLAMCTGRPVAVIQNLSKEFDHDNITIDWGDGKITNEEDIRHVYEHDNVYTIKVKNTREIGGELCISEKIEPFYALSLHVPNVITPVLQDGKNDEFIIQYGGVGGKPADYGYRADLKIYNRWGKLVFRDEDYQNTWRGESLEAGVYYYQLNLNDGRESCKGYIQLMK